MGVKLEDHIAKLLKRVDEWIAEQKETASLEKARVDEGKTDYQKQAARADRAGSWEKENLGTAGSGHSKIKEITHFLHNSKLDQIKRSPKPNFPAEPVDKSIEDQMFYEKHKKQIHQEGKARRAAMEAKPKNSSLAEKLSSWINKPKAVAAPQAPVEQPAAPTKLAASEKTPVVMTAKQAVKEHKELVHVLKTPSHKDDLKEAKEQGAELKEYKQKLDKSATVKKPHNLDLTHVATVETPKELHPFISGGHPVPYDHPHRELAAKFVTDVWRKNKPEGKRMSEKLLGIGENGKVNPAAKQGYSTVKAEKKDYAAPTPADVSAPAIINERRTMTGRNYISGPDIISGYPSAVGMSGEPKDKDMKKSELAKSLKKLFGKELDKAQEKGVHPVISARTKQGAATASERQDSKEPSLAGLMVDRSKNAKDPLKTIAGAQAKNIHQSVLTDLKAMPKPNLPKSEKSLEKLDPVSHQPGTMLDKASPEYLYKMKTFGDGLKKYCSSKIEKANAFETKAGLKGQDTALKMVRATNPNSGPKGVHQPHFMAGKKTGTSDVGARMMSGVKPSKATKEHAMKEHKNVLTDLKAMPKPNLPKSEAPIAKSDSSLKKNSKFKELEAKLNAIMPSKPVNPEIQAAAKAKVAAGMQARVKHDQMQKDRSEKLASEQKLKQDLLLPENIKLDRPKYLTLQQGHEAILNGKPNPMQEAGKNKPQHLDDVKLLNSYHGKNIITGVHDQPVKSWGNETYLMHPDGKLDFQHAEYDTSDARK